MGLNRILSKAYSKTLFEEIPTNIHINSSFSLSIVEILMFSMFKNYNEWKVKDDADNKVD